MRQLWHITVLLINGISPKIHSCMESIHSHSYIHKLMNNGRAITVRTENLEKTKLNMWADVCIPLFEKFCIHCIDKYLMRSKKRVQRWDFARFKFQTKKIERWAHVCCFFFQIQRKCACVWYCPCGIYAIDTSNIHILNNLL